MEKAADLAALTWREAVELSPTVPRVAQFADFHVRQLALFGKPFLNLGAMALFNFAVSFIRNDNAAELVVVTTAKREAIWLNCLFEELVDKRIVFSQSQFAHELCFHKEAEFLELTEVLFLELA